MDAEVRYSHQIDVIEFRYSPGFQLKSLPAHFGYLIRGNHFEGAFFAQCLMSSQIDFAHATAADHLNNLIDASNHGAWSQTDGGASGAAIYSAKNGAAVGLFEPVEFRTQVAIGKVFIRRTFALGALKEETGEGTGSVLGAKFEAAARAKCSVVLLGRASTGGASAVTGSKQKAGK